MRIATALFDGPKSSDYARLALVLKTSAAINCPSAEFTMHTASEVANEILAARRNCPWVYLRNAMKTKMHMEIVHAADDGDELCLIDCDTMILRDLSPVWQHDFELACTLKPAGSTYVCNSGVIFVRVSTRIREFYSAWYATVLRMLADKKLHEQWKKTWGGINQAALGWMLAHCPQYPRRLKLQCDEWNACKESWPTAIERARVVHILKPLKTRCLDARSGGVTESIIHLAEIWQQFERESLENVA